jgi:rubrerythrin
MQKTIKNLIAAYLGEAQARQRYTFYASAAKKEGYEQIAEIMTTTAEQEKKHGKTFYEFLVKLNKQSDGLPLSGEMSEGQRGSTPTKIELPMDLEIEVVLGTTADNLKSSIALENDEFANLYPKFADEAEAEGFPEIAAKFRAIAHAEEHHKMNFEKLLALVESGTYFKDRGVQVRVCRECGYMVVGDTAPTICPSCDHPQAYFERLQNDY